MTDKLIHSLAKVGRTAWSRGNQRGQSLIIVALLIISLLAAVGLAIDLGLMYIEKVKLGRAVDAAALAGAQELPDSFAAVDRMWEYFQLNGYDQYQEGVEISYDFPADGCDAHGNCYNLEITARATVSLTFMRVLGFRTVQVAAHAIGENANRLDIAIVLDVSGSMNDDTCKYIGGEGPLGCDYSGNYAWESYTDIVVEDFSGYDLYSGTMPDKLCSATSPWLCNDPNRVGVEFASQRAVTDGCGSYSWPCPNGQFYRRDTFDASTYDWIEVVFLNRVGSNCSWNSDFNAAWYNRGSGWNEFWSDGTCPSSYEWVVETIDPLLSSTFNVRFGARQMENGEEGRFDDIRVRGLVELAEPIGDHLLSDCPNSEGSGCVGAGYKQQPIYDTLAAADWFITECEIGSGEHVYACLDPDLDQVGLAYYSDDGTMNNCYEDTCLSYPCPPYCPNPNPSSDSGTATELDFDYSAVTNALYTQFQASGWTNIGDGIFEGCDILSTNVAEGHHGRTNAIHVMILLSDGIPNRPCEQGGSWNWCHRSDSWAMEHIEDAVSWAQANSIIIFTISLGSEAQPDMMRTVISEPTGGTHHHAETTEDLQEIFQDIAEHIFLRLIT